MAAEEQQDIWVSAFSVLVAHHSEQLVELRKELGTVAVKHGIDSTEVKDLQSRIAEVTAERDKAEAELVRVKERIAAGVTIITGSIPPTLPPSKTPKKAKPIEPSKSAIKLIDASVEIMSNAPEWGDMAFTHAVLCQVGLPRSKFEGREFMRQSGAAWINVQAGYLDEGNGPVQQPVPYGPLPRLALAWISTQAVRTKDREIAIGNSASEFLRLLGKPTTGGERGSFGSLRKQMHALAACRLQLGFKGRTYNGQPVEQFDAWLANKDTGQHALWPGVMVLSDGYFSSLLESAVPLDNRALMALSDSALALDVYTWLAHRLHRIEGRGVTIHWKALREQFAQEYQGKDPDKDFKKKFLPALKKVLAVYPEAKVKPVTGGVLLLGSPPPIAYKG
jgi:hypothetical protein